MNYRLMLLHLAGRLAFSVATGILVQLAVTQINIACARRRKLKTRRRHAIR